MPILCGGTGLYLARADAGLADIPDPGEPARAEARALLAAEGAAALHARLAADDPDTAARLRPATASAWPAPGRCGAAPGAAWRLAGRRARPERLAFRAVLLDPPRPALRAAIAARFDAMLAAGALAEVAALLALGLDPALPAMRAHGVPELSAVLRGELTLAEAAPAPCLATGQYTKRQATWFRHQPSLTADDAHDPCAIPDPAQLSERWMAGMQSFLHGSG